MEYGSYIPYGYKPTNDYIDILSKAGINKRCDMLRIMFNKILDAGLYPLILIGLDPFNPLWEQEDPRKIDFDKIMDDYKSKKNGWETKKEKPSILNVGIRCDKPSKLIALHWVESFDYKKINMANLMGKLKIKKHSTVFIKIPLDLGIIFLFKYHKYGEYELPHPNIKIIQGYVPSPYSLDSDHNLYKYNKVKSVEEINFSDIIEFPLKKIDSNKNIPQTKDKIENISTDMSEKNNTIKELFNSLPKKEKISHVELSKIMDNLKLDNHYLHQLLEYLLTKDYNAGNIDIEEKTIPQEKKSNDPVENSYNEFGLPFLFLNAWDWVDLTKDEPEEITDRVKISVILDNFVIWKNKNYPKNKEEWTPKSFAHQIRNHSDITIKKIANVNHYFSKRRVTEIINKKEDIEVIPTKKKKH